METCLALRQAGRPPLAASRKLKNLRAVGRADDHLPRTFSSKPSPRRAYSPVEQKIERHRRALRAEALHLGDASGRDHGYGTERLACVHIGK